MRILVTGGAGFIGSHLVDRLLKKQHNVKVIDNLSTGKKEFIQQHFRNPRFTFFQKDLFEKGLMQKALTDIDIVYHFAANADVRGGLVDTNKDIRQGLLATRHVLEEMRKQEVKKIIFPSSMTVYGKVNKAVSEDFGPCLPISLYAASKLSSEGLISAYCGTYGMRGYIFRFANVIGPRLTHGVIFDLIHKLLKNPLQLEVLGNGLQTKPYIWIDDLLDGMEFVVKHTKESIDVFNIGAEDAISVKEIVSIILKQMDLSPMVEYGTTAYGWVGDVTECSLNVNKLKKLGFTSKYNSTEAVEKTITAVLSHINYGK